MPEVLKTGCHAAYVVENLEAAMEGKTVLIPPFEPMETLRCAFITDGAAVIELMQYTAGSCQSGSACGCSCS